MMKQQYAFDTLFVVSRRTGCWLWTGATDTRGYGRYMIKGKRHRAHRYALRYEGSLYVCHTCDTPRCVNPEHLFLGTQADNMQDRYWKEWKRDRQNSGVYE